MPGFDFRSCRFTFALVLVFDLAAARSAGATIRYVPVPYATIQSALAASGDFDTVLVAQGIYYGPITVPGRPLMLGAANCDPLTTILDGSPPGGPASDEVLHVVETDRGPQIIDGFTIRNGNLGLGARPVPIDGPCSANLVIRRCRFLSNNPGGAIDHFNGLLTLTECYFADHVVVGVPGVVRHTGSAQIERNTFERNVTSSPEGAAAQGGALYLDGSGTSAFMTIMANVFRENRSGGDGGAVLILAALEATISENQFERNDAAWAGGALRIGGPATVTSNLFVENDSPQGGAVALTGGGRQSLSFNTIVGRSAGFPGGEAVRIEKSAGTALLEYNLIAFGAGAGVRWVGAGGALNCNDVFGHAAGEIEGTPPPGGANFSLDPQFCDRAGANFLLEGNSPCLPGAAPCGGTARVGALGYGCPAVAVEAVTWGRLKALFHR